MFGTDIDSIPQSVPYLHANADRVAHWAKQLGDRSALRVGLVWAGNPIHKRDSERSMSLESLAPLLEIPGAHFYSLQKGSGESQVDASPLKDRITPLGPQLKDFEDTAAVISLLDLVIGVDTAVAHLAGAMGKPVWLLVQKDGEWRWLADDRTDSPWYPTMRIFRQSALRDWRGTVQQVRIALEAVVGGVAPLEAGPAASDDSGALAIVDIESRGKPTAADRTALSTVVESRVGVLQYLPRDEPLASSLAWYGEYLQPQLDLIANIVKPGATVVEVAAGIGVHTIAIAEMLGPTGHLYAFESRPLEQRLLRQNLAANAIRNVTTLGSFLGSRDARPDGVAALPVEQLDGFQYEQLHLLKIDVEADAVTILNGATETLWRLRPLLFIAAPDDGALDAIVALIRELGYRSWRMQTPLHNPGNFYRRQEDIFSGKSVLAIVGIPEELDVDIDLGQCVEL